MSLVGSMFIFIKGVYQSGKHSADFFQSAFQTGVFIDVDQIASFGQLQKRDAFLNRAAGDAEEVFAVGFREPAVALGPAAPGLAAIEREARLI